MVPLARVEYNAFLVQPRLLFLEESPQHGTGGKKRRRRSVAFSEKVDVFTIPNRQQYTLEELEALYMSKKEHKSIQNEVLNLIRELLEQQRKQTQQNTISVVREAIEEDPILRGLETVFPSEVATDRRQWRRNAIDSVVRHQSYEAAADHDWIANMYGKHSAPSVSLARMRGLKDEQESPFLPPRSLVMHRS